MSERREGGRQRERKRKREREGEGEGEGEGERALVADASGKSARASVCVSMHFFLYSPILQYFF
jgi:hypothetical protein